MALKCLAHVTALMQALLCLYKHLSSEFHLLGNNAIKPRVENVLSGQGGLTTTLV
jgi:hypothetical protein